MFNSYLIETEEEVAGIVVRAGQGFRFHAVGPGFKQLEEQRFASPRKAERAAMQLQQSRRRKAEEGRR